jgi:hypothetical protein
VYNETHYVKENPMFTKTPKEKSDLEVTIIALFNRLKTMDAETEEYAAIVDQIVKLYKLKSEDAPNRVDANTWAAIGANLIGILLVLKHEQAFVVTSKAFSWIGRLVK